VNLLNREETERTIVAAQDPAVGNNSFKNKILKEKLTVNVGYVRNIKKLLTT
jgi:hypothetical protein